VAVHVLAFPGFPVHAVQPRYSDSRMTVPRNRSVQVDATPRSGDPARCKIGNTYSGIALVAGLRQLTPSR
jgi:hypothetical protein